jgi:hypothetical protein
MDGWSEITNTERDRQIEVKNNGRKKQCEIKHYYLSSTHKDEFITSKDLFIITLIIILISDKYVKDRCSTSPYNRRFILNL